MDIIPDADASPDQNFGIDLSAYRRKNEVSEPRQNALNSGEGEADAGNPFGIDLSAYRTKRETEAVQTEASDNGYYPPVTYSISEDSPAIRPEIREMGTPEQRTLAISRLPGVKDQMRMFAIAGDFQNIYNLARHVVPKDSGETSAIAQELDAPEEMIRLMQRYEPDALEAKRLAAYVNKTMGPDDYITRKLGDINFVGDWKNEVRDLADLQAAINSTHASTPKIMLDWFAGSAANVTQSIAFGIPAAASQAWRGVRGVVPGLGSVEQGIDGLLQDRRDLLDSLPEMAKTSPGTAQMLDALMLAPLQRAAEWAGLSLPGSTDEVHDQIQQANEDTAATVYLPQATTGNDAVDHAVRPVVQGLGSSVPSLGLGVIGRGATRLPAFLFGAAEAGEGYRERAAAGTDPITNALFSLMQGGIGAKAEQFGLEGVFNQPGLRGMWRDVAGNANTILARTGRVAGGAAVAGGGEAVAEGVQTGTGVLATSLSAGISRGDSVSQLMASAGTALQQNSMNILESMWGGFGAGTVGGGTVGNFGREMADAWSYSAFQKSLSRVGDAAKKVSDKKGSVEKTREVARNGLYDAMAQGKTNLTGTSFADGMDVERYCQTLPPAEAEAFLEGIGTNRAAVEQAVENNIDIEVATENLLALPEGVDPKIRQLFRPKPSMATASYLQGKISAIDETFTLADKLKVTLEQDIERGTVPEGINIFYRDLRDNLKMPAKDAKQNTALLWAWAQTTAARRGVSAEEFLDSRIIRAATDTFVRNNPAWLNGVLDGMTRNQQGNTDAILDESADFEEGIADPAIMEVENDASLSEQQGEENAAEQPAPTESGRDAPVAVDSGSGGDGEQDGGVEAAQPQRSLFGDAVIEQPAGGNADRLTGLPISLETTTTEGVKAAPNVFQFKRSANEDTGVKKGQELPGDIDPAALGTMVFYEDVDKTRFVVSGHHRLDLLRRKGQDAEIRAVILREADGWTTDQARAYGAALNIKEGGGDVDDYATFFRESRIGRDLADSEGLLRRENARLGYAIGAQGGENTFYGFLNEELSAKRAAAIATAAPGDAQLQDMMISRKVPTNELEIFAGYVNKMRNSGKLNLSGVQKSLFAGTDYEAMLAVMEKESKAAAKEADKLDKQAASLEALIRAGKVLSPSEMNRHGVRAGNKAGMAERAAKLREDAQRWKNFFHHPDVLAQVKELAGTAMKQEVFSQTAYHGSPYRFDRFSTEFMGSGEGNQAYGWGLYFSGDKVVSESYRENLSLRVPLEGQYAGRQIYRDSEEDWRFKDDNSLVYDDNQIVAKILRFYGNKKNGEVIEDLETLKRNYDVDLEIGSTIFTPFEVDYAIEMIKDGTISISDPGTLYKTEIPNDNELLKWDEVVSAENSRKIAEQAEREGYGNYELSYRNDEGEIVLQGSNLTGEKLYRIELRRVLGSARAVSEFLNRSGIKGIKYIGERNKSGQDDGVNNYVIFDDNAIDIIETYYQGTKDKARGEVELYRADATQRQAAIIRAMRGADRSLVPHELSHIFLDDARTWVTSGSAAEAAKSSNPEIASAAKQAIRDFGILTHWAGRINIDPDLEEGTPEYESQKAEVRENIEKVSRGFEQYLLDGRAPSIELISPFSLFSNWLTRIYANIRQYVGLNMNDRVRGVYDRWLASDRQIAEARAYYQGRIGNTFVNLLKDDEEKQKLEERRDQNEKRVRQRYAGDMVGAWMEANANQEEVTAEVQAEIDAAPAYRAIEAARENRIDRSGAVAIVGEQTVTDIINKHGDIFKKTEAMPSDALDAELKKAGYFDENPRHKFLSELLVAEPVEEAVKKQGSHGRRKRYYEVAEALQKSGGIDLDSAIAEIGDQAVNRIIDIHGGGMFSSGYAGIEHLATEQGFSSGEEMLLAMSKAPNAADMLEAEFQNRMNDRTAAARKWATDQVDQIADSALHNPQEDIDAETIDLTRQAIYRAMDAREKRESGYTDRRVIAERARIQLARSTMRKAANYSNWGMAERRWAGKAAEAAAAGERRAALEALDKQQYYHALITESFRIRQEDQRFNARWSYRTARSGLDGVKYEYRQAMMDILHDYGIIKSRAFIPEKSVPGQLLIPVESDGLIAGDKRVDEDLDVFEPPLKNLIPDWLKRKEKPQGYINYKDLTVTQVRELNETLGLLQNRGRGELNVLRSEQAATIEEKKNLLINSLEQLPDHDVSDERSWWNRRKKGSEEYLASTLLIDRIASDVDGNPMLKGKEMGEMQRMIDLIRKCESGEKGQMTLLEQFQKDSQEDFAILDQLPKLLKKMFGSKTFPIDGVEMPALIQEKKGIKTYDANMLLGIFFNMGNKGNLFALQQGLGFSDAQLARLAKLMTVEQWQALERIGKRLEDFYPALDEVYFRMTNRHLPRVEPTPFTIEAADGVVSVSGWYFPLVYDPKLSNQADQQQEMADFIAGMNAIYAPSKPIDGFTKGRAVDEDGNPVVARPPLLATSVLNNHLVNMTRWMTHVEALYEFRRITMDGDFKDVFVKKLGAEKYRYLREWTNRMARPDKGKATGSNRIFSTLRNVSTTAALGLNIKSAFRQTESLGIAADAMSKSSHSRSSGWYWLIQGFKEMGLGGLTKTAVHFALPGSGLLPGVEWTPDAALRMREKSAEAKMRAGNINKEIRDMIQRTDPTRREFRIGGITLSRDMFFRFTRIMDDYVSSICWWGAYHQAMNGHAGFETDGLTEEQIEKKAITHADYILRSQQSPFTADFTKVQADPGVWSLFTQFMSGTTFQHSHTVGMIGETRRGNTSKADLLRTFINVYAIPNFAKVVVGGALAGAIFGWDDEDEIVEGMAKDMAWGIANSATSALPGYRDAVGVLQFGERSATPPGLALPARVISYGKRGVLRLSDGDVEAGAADFGRALREALPFNQALKQGWQAGQAVGAIEE